MEIDRGRFKGASGGVKSRAFGIGTIFRIFTTNQTSILIKKIFIGNEDSSFRQNNLKQKKKK